MMNSLFRRMIAPASPVLIALAAMNAMRPARAQDAPTPATTQPGLSYVGAYAQSNSAVLDTANAEPGVTVTQVIENSPAEAAGLKPEDVILQVNGQDITDPAQLLAVIEALPVGSRVDLSVERDAEIKQLSAITVARVAPPPDNSEPGAAGAGDFSERKRLGVRFKAADPELAARLRLAPRQGVQVIAVSPEGPMDKAGVKEGDIIITANGEAIYSPQVFLKLVEDTAAKSKAIELGVVNRSGLVKDTKVKFFAPERRATKIGIPLIFTYNRTPTSAETKALGGLFSRERLENATKYRLFWLFKFETGSSSELLEVGS